MPTFLSEMDRDADELQARSASRLMQLLESPEAQLATGGPKNPEKELALLAFGFPGNQDAMVVWCNDGYVRWEISEQGPHEVATYILDNNAPDHGIWVWEGRVHQSPYPDHNGEYDGPEYITIQWRSPTEDEWEAIQEQRNPFEPKPKDPDEDIDWNWGRKTSL